MNIMNAEEITKGSTLLATLNEENYPFGQHKDLINDLHRMINKALNIDSVVVTEGELCGKSNCNRPKLDGNVYCSYHYEINFG